MLSKVDELPFREDAETAVLSALLTGEPDAWSKVAGTLTPADFYGGGNGLVFKALETLATDGVAIDPVTLAHQLEQTGKLDEAGGKEHIGFLIGAIPTAENIEHHASIVRHYAEARRLVLALEREALALRTGTKTPAEVAEGLVQHTLQATTGNGKGFVTAADIMKELSVALMDRANGNGMVGIPTGFREFDEQTGGIRDGELAIICGVPGSGKTAIALQIALHNAVELETPNAVGIVSAEMTKAALMERGVANVGRINTRRLRTMRLEPDEYQRIGNAFAVLQKAPIHIDDTPTPSIGEVVARCRALKMRVPGLKLIVVDFLQLLSNKGDDDTRAEELRTMAYALKGLGKELQCAFIVLVQPNDKELEKRSDKRPQLNDLQGSSGPRQAADFVLLCYRPKQYDDTEPLDIVQVNIAKAREVSTFTIELQAQLHYMRIADKQPTAGGGLIARG